MRHRKGFVEIELAKVEAKLAGADHAENAVGVGLIVGAKPAGLVHDIIKSARKP